MILPAIALPTGPYDWHPEHSPRSVYDTRLAAVRAMMRAERVTHLIVHGSVLDHGALAWLTHVTPKLGPAYALVPDSGPLRLLFSGGPGMRPSAQRLTWVEDVVALRGLSSDLGRWLGETGGHSVRLGLVEGQAMARCDWLEAQAAAADGGTIGLDTAVDAARRAKTADELASIRQGAGLLAAVATVLCQGLGERGSRSAALDAEREAYAGGAQDVRIRIGAEPWGAPLPLRRADEIAMGPTRIAVALRHAGYWCEGRFVAGAVDQAIAAPVRAAIGTLRSRLWPGADLETLARGLAPGLRLTGTGIGLSTSEAPDLARGDRLAADDVCSLAITSDVGKDRRAVWSLLATITADGHDLIWSAPGLGL